MKSITEYLFESANDARIFVVIKPGFLDLSKEVIKRFAQDEWMVERSCVKQLQLSEAKRLYKSHNKEDWYKSLCEYMSSDRSMAFIFINRSKKMTPDIFKETDAIKDEIRKEYGESEMRNVMHSSDSIANMELEKTVYFAF